MTLVAPETKVVALKDILIRKEKLIQKQKQLIDNNTLKRMTDKVKYINDPLLKNNNVDPGIGSSLQTSLNKKKPLPAVPQNNTNTVIRGQVQNGNKNSSPLSKSRKKSDIYTDDDTTRTQNSPRFLPTPQQTSPSLLKYNKLENIASKKVKLESKLNDNNKKVKKNKKTGEIKNRFFPAKFAQDYCKIVGNKSFSLPKDEYQDLMNNKIKQEKKKCLIKTDNLDEKERDGFKFIAQISQILETNKDYGPIINCSVDKNNLIIVQRDKINIYTKKTKDSKEWILKDCMTKLRNDNVIKNMIITCKIRKKKMPVFCEIYLLKDLPNKKSFMKMAQYRFFNESGKCMKEYLFGSFDSDLEGFQCCSLGKNHCTVAVSCWAASQSRTVAWVFTYSDENDTMMCTPMIPIKHEVKSLHDMTVSVNKPILLAFGTRSFTVWNAKTGERFTHCVLTNISPSRNIRCLYGVFATIQKGFLFIVAIIKDRLHMIAVNMATGMNKSLRNFKLPKDHTCLGAAVKEDKLIGITDKAVICWSLRTTSKLQQLKLKEDDKPYLIQDKVLIMNENNFRKLLFVKSLISKDDDDDDNESLKPSDSRISYDRKSIESVDSTSS